MHLMILENKRLRTTLRPEASTVSIGSSPKCAVHLPDPRISSHQATIIRGDDGAWWLEVVDASVPTCLNRAVQKSRAKLRHADEIEVGPFSIRLFMEADKSREEVQRDRMSALARKHGETLPLGAIVHLTENAVTISKDHLEQLTLLGLKLAHAETIRDLLPLVLRAMLRLVGGRRTWIGIRSNPRGVFDWTLGFDDQARPTERPPFSITMENRCLAHTQYVCCPETPTAGVRSSMCVPLACEGGNLGILYIENDPADTAFDEASLAVFSALACCVARPVENTLLKTAAKRQVAASTELTISRATQDAITIRALPHWDEIQIAAYRRMGSSKCCDYYDVVQLQDRTASVIMAKVMIEGLAVPRLLGEIRSAFRSASLHADQPHMFCRALNWMLFAGEGRSLVSLIAYWLAPKTGKVQCCVAGEGVALRRIGASGDVHALSTAAGLAIGRTKAPAYESTPVDLAPGDTLLAATAGLTTARSNEDKPFGFATLEETIADGVGERPGSLLTEFEEQLNEHVKNGVCPDDVSVVLTRWR